MVLLGAIFKCLDPILILASLESNRNFFLRPPSQQDRSFQVRSTMALGQSSDHLAALNAYREWRFIKNTRGRAAAMEFAYDNLMHVGSLSTIEKTSEQMLDMLVKWGLAKHIPVYRRYNHELGDPELNLNADVQPLMFAILSAGLAPNFAVQMGPIILQTTADSKSMIHPASLNSNGREISERRGDKKFKYVGAGPPGTFILFSEKGVSQGGVFLRETSVIGPMTGLLFSSVSYAPEERNIVNVDGWIPMRFEFGGAESVYELNQCLLKVLCRFTLVLTKVLEANMGSTEGRAIEAEIPFRGRRFFP
jgi:ATP-dependent RNA helicase DHX36